MLWAVTGHTAAEIVALRGDPDAPTMGLTSWRGEVVRKGDVAVAETQARRRAMTMAEWAERLDAFLSSPPSRCRTLFSCRSADDSRSGRCLWKLPSAPAAARRTGLSGLDHPGQAEQSFQRHRLTDAGRACLDAAVGDAG